MANLVNDVSISTVTELVVASLLPMVEAGIIDGEVQERVKAISIAGFETFAKELKGALNEMPVNVFTVSVYILSSEAIRLGVESNWGAALALAGAQILANMEAHPNTFFHPKVFPFNASDNVLLELARASCKVLMERLTAMHPEWLSLIVVLKGSVTFIHSDG